jgi:hypothetical protein
LAVTAIHPNKLIASRTLIAIAPFSPNGYLTMLIRIKDQFISFYSTRPSALIPCMKPPRQSAPDDEPNFMTSIAESFTSAGVLSVNQGSRQMIDLL